MKKHIILPITLAAMMMLGGCNPSKQPTTPIGPDTTNTTPEVVVNSVSITNKEALQADWFVGTATRKVAVTADPEIEDINELLDNNTLTIVSSNPEVVTVTRLMLAAKAAGKATITVNYGGKTDSVEITVKAEQTAIEKYGTIHAGTAEDPFDNEDACKVAPLAKDASDSTKYYVKGIIESFYHTVGSRSDGAVSWYFTPADGKTEKFEAYKIFKADGSFLTDDDVWKGAEVVVSGVFTVYNSQAETDTGVFVENTGNGAAKPADPINIDATVAEALAVGKALADGDSTWDYYTVTGYVVLVEGKNLYLADSKDAATTDKTALYELYLDYFAGKTVDSTGADAVASKGAKVSLKAKIKNYHGQIETDVIEGNLTVLEAGEEVVIPVIEGYGTAEAPLTIAQAKTVLDATGASVITAEKIFVKGVVTSSSKGTNGYTIWLQSDDGLEEKAFELYNVNLASSITGDYTAVDALKGKEVVATGWGELYKTTYEITSKKNDDGTYDNGEVLSVADAAKVAAAKVEVSASAATLTVGETKELTAKVYPINHEGTVAWTSSDEAVATVSPAGVVTAVAGGTATITATIGTVTDTCEITVSAASFTKLAAYNLANFGSTAEITDVAAFATTLGTKTTDTNVITEVTAASKVYGSYSGYESLGLKFGSSKAAGTFTVKLSSTVTRVVINATGWAATDTIAVNDCEAQAPGAAYTETGATKELTYDFAAATDTVTFTWANRGFISDITFYTL